ncbi:MAG: helix-hairpin-helix domain-containing protein [Candidatus Omnitrophica bacterium]|nr:helix-hairpin-helix domain-containing protein [Candidatus Omnitrophota bacterium]
MIILTPQERRSVIFIGAVFLCGICLQVILKLYPPGYQQLTFLDRPSERLAVDVNRASYEELLAVPGIGPSVAARIIYARDNKGSFKSLDELHGIKGFSKKSMARADAHLMAGHP